jgi:hypothetical protein
VIITINALIKSIADGIVYRILWFNEKDDIVYLFNMETQAIPQAVRYSDIEKRIADGELQNEIYDPYIRMSWEDEIPKKIKQARDQIWELVSDLVLSEPVIYEKDKRGKLVSEKNINSGKTSAAIYRHLKRYWFYGKSKNAFLPQFKNRGGKGKERSTSAEGVKRGRPRKYDSGGINIDADIRNKFEKAIKKYYHNRKEYTFTAAYEMMLREFFSERTKQRDGSVTMELLPADKLPTIGQFRYWYSKTYNIREKVSLRKGETAFALEYRSIIGKSDYTIIGPGSKYQIDATIGDIYLVSRFDRTCIIGRPVIYFIIDMFSRMVTGLYVGLEGPSWAGAMMALANAMTGKIKYCEAYGVEISENDWPCRHVPEAILGDRGEMEGNAVETLINTLGVRIENAPPYRGDMKGIVERKFRTINGGVTALLPGHVKPDMAKRGGKDYRLDAKLDLHQFTKIMILSVLYENNEHLLETYERDADMISDNIPPIPIKLWEWGIQNRSGLLRVCDEVTVKLCLMPTETATVSAKGIRFKGLYYLSDRAIAEHWFEKARAKGSFKVTVSYDPRNMSNIYARILGENTFDLCFLAEWEDKYLNRRLEEIVYLMEAEKQMQKKHAPAELKAKLDLNAEIENIVRDAEKMARQTAIPASKAQRTRDIRANRGAEKNRNRVTEAFIPTDTATEQINQQIFEEEEISPAMRLIINDLEERLNDKR